MKITSKVPGIDFPYLLKVWSKKEFPLVKDILTIFKNSKITSIEFSDA